MELEWCMKEKIETEIILEVEADLLNHHQINKIKNQSVGTFIKLWENKGEKFQDLCQD